MNSYRFLCSQSYQNLRKTYFYLGLKIKQENINYQELNERKSRYIRQNSWNKKEFNELKNK